MQITGGGSQKRSFPPTAVGKQAFPLSLGRHFNQKPSLQGKSLRQKLVEIKAYLKFFDDGNFTPR